MEARGTPKRQQNTKLKKNGVVLNSVAPFFMIFVKNGSQDGGPNPSKIDEKSIQILQFFLNGFLKHFGWIWEPEWKKNRCKNDAKNTMESLFKLIWKLFTFGFDFLLIFVDFGTQKFDFRRGENAIFIVFSVSFYISFLDRFFFHFGSQIH